MTITSKGFDGSLNEDEFAKLLALAGVTHAVAGPLDYNVTAVPGSRAVSVAAGRAYAPGVASTNSAPVTVTVPTPTAGAWHLIVLHRDWSDNSAVLQRLAHTTTSSAVPTVAPSTFPATDSNPGVLDDQVLAWAWVNASNNDVLIFDIRDLTITAQFAALRSEIDTHTHPPTDIVGSTAVGQALMVAADRDAARAQLGIFVRSTPMTGANAVGDVRWW